MFTALVVSALWVTVASDTRALMEDRTSQVTKILDNSFEVAKQQSKLIVDV